MTPHNRDSKQNEWQTYSSQSGCQSVVMQTLEQRRMQLAAHCGSEPLVQEQRSPKIQSDTRMSPEPPAPHGSAPTPQALQQLEARDVWEAPAHNVICTDTQKYGNAQQTDQPNVNDRRRRIESAWCSLRDKRVETYYDREHSRPQPKSRIETKVAPHTLPNTRLDQKLSLRRRGTRRRRQRNAPLCTTHQLSEMV